MTDRRNPGADGSSDDEVRDRYRRAATERVPHHLDEQILGLAADAADQPASGYRKGAWFRPLGLAAAVALSLVVLLDSDPPSQNPVVEDFSSAASDAADRIRDLGQTTSASRPLGDPTTTSSDSSNQAEMPHYCSERESEIVADWWACIRGLRESGLREEAEAETRRLLREHPGSNE